MNLDAPSFYCTCIGGDHDPCDLCAAFESWEYALTEAQRGELALRFLSEHRSLIEAAEPHQWAATPLESAFMGYMAEHFAMHVYGVQLAEQAEMRELARLDSAADVARLCGVAA